MIPIRINDLVTYNVIVGPIGTVVEIRETGKKVEETNNPDAAVRVKLPSGNHIIVFAKALQKEVDKCLA
jgi:hypothetical protein